MLLIVGMRHGLGLKALNEMPRVDIKLVNSEMQISQLNLISPQCYSGQNN